MPRDPSENEVSAIKERAKARGRELKLPYAGALLPAEAFALMQQGARLVDVRTKPEFSYVGRVPGTSLVFGMWKSITVSGLQGFG